MDKRKDYISWDEYFMGLAILSSKRSKDPNTQVGACIVDKNNNIIDTDINWYVSFNGNSEIGMVSNYYNGIYYIKLNGEKLFETLVVDQE